jgi:hypothetical protein
MAHFSSASRRRRRARLAAVTITAALALAATAVASGPKPGTYKGSFKGGLITVHISLKLTGTKLGPVKISNIPLYCAGGGQPLVFTFPKATISGAGGFTLHGVNKIKIGPLKGKVGEVITLTGTFTRHGTVSGTVKTAYPRAPKSCAGSSRFSAKH